jgi:hypothetical protein
MARAQQSKIARLGWVTTGSVASVNPFLDALREKPYRSGRSPDWIKVKNLDAPAAAIRLIEG